MGEPESNRYWFPGYDSPNDFRTTELTATVDKNLTVISNGSLVETKDNPGRHAHVSLEDGHALRQLSDLICGRRIC